MCLLHTIGMDPAIVAKRDVVKRARCGSMDPPKIHQGVSSNNSFCYGPKRWRKPQYFRAKQNAERLHGALWKLKVSVELMYSLRLCRAFPTTQNAFN